MIDPLSPPPAQTTDATTNLVGSLKKKLAEQEREYEELRRRMEIVGPRLREMRTSRSWRITAPLRWLTTMISPPRYDIHQLMPFGGMTLNDDGTWTCTTYDLQFLLPCHLRRGWVRIKFRLEQGDFARTAVYFDFGDGFTVYNDIQLEGPEQSFQFDKSHFLQTDAIGIRFDPRDRPGWFRLKEFSVQQERRISMPLHGFWKRLREVRRQGKLRPVLARGMRLLASGRWHELAEAVAKTAVDDLSNNDHRYRVWMNRHALTNDDRAIIRKQITQMVNPPIISLIVPVYNVPEKYLRLMIDSVLRQLYPHWELCLVDDCSPSPHIRRVLEEYARRDPRIKVKFQEKNGGISAASNAAIALATGSYLGLLDHDDEIPEHALFSVAREIVADPTLDMLYSDEDKLSPDGERSSPFFKPDWSPEYFLSCMYTCHFGVYRASLVRQIGGFRSEYDTAQDYDLVLRVTARTDRIKHIPDILYHWRVLPTSTAGGHSAKPDAERIARKAIQDYLDSQPHGGKALAGNGPGQHKIEYPIRPSEKVSIIIPTAARNIGIDGKKMWHVHNCVKSIRKSTYENREVLVLYDGTLDPELEADLLLWGAKCIPYTSVGPFNLSAKFNAGAAAATGKHLLFLNDDIEIIAPNWLESLVQFSQLPGVGAVGGKLLYPDNTIQHAGVFMVNGDPGHPFIGLPANILGYFNCVVNHRNCITVTGAMLMTSRETFDSVHGFDLAFPMNFNDVDYCLRVLATNRRIIYSPDAVAYHHESASQTGLQVDEVHKFHKHWKAGTIQDPYFNPNLIGNYLVNPNARPWPWRDAPR